MIRISGLDQIDKFVKDLSTAFYLEMERDISRAFEAWTKVIFKDLVMTTPQWSGDLATNWNYSINSINENYTEVANKTAQDMFARFEDTGLAEVYSRGDNPAVASAIMRASMIHPTWRDVVYFNNPTPIADAVENQSITIRPVNLVDGRVAMVQYYVDAYNRGEYQP